MAAPFCEFIPMPSQYWDCSLYYATTDTSCFTDFWQKYIGVFYKANIRECFRLNPRFLF